MSYKLLPSIVLAGMVVLFIIQNVTIVEVKFLFWTLQISRALLMVLIMSIGIFMGWLLHINFSRMKTVKI